MAQHPLVEELEDATRQLQLAPMDAEGCQAALIRRASVVHRISSTPPQSFSQADLESLRAAAVKGCVIIEHLTLVRRDLGAEWLRLNQMRESTDGLQCTVVSYTA